VKLSELRTLCDEAETLVERLEARTPLHDGHFTDLRLRIALRHAEERFDRRLRKLYAPRRPDVDVRPTEERSW
jgi:hypothetical protein